MHHFRLPLFIFTSLILAVCGCNPNGAEYVDELDLVISLKNDTVDYDNYSTYMIADTLMLLSNSENSKISLSQQNFILSEIKQRMDQHGWVQADTAQDTADVFILVSVLENVNVSVWNDWWYYWGGWWGWPYTASTSSYWYYPGYPGYPGYGPCCYTSVYAYTTGSLLIEMVDPNNIQDIEGIVPSKMPIIWGGGINGLLEGSQTNINQRIERSLDQLFKDSPYLDKI